MLPPLLSEANTVQDTLEMVAVILTILTALVALIRVLILTPLDRKLEAHTDRMLVTIEHRFLDTITKRMDAIESISHARSRQGLLWAKSLYEALKDQSIKVPDPEMYIWEAARRSTDGEHE